MPEHSTYIYSPYHEIVKEREGLPLPSKELLCLESIREVRLYYRYSVLQMSKEKWNI